MGGFALHILSSRRAGGRPRKPREAVGHPYATVGVRDVSYPFHGTRHCGRSRTSTMPYKSLRDVRFPNLRRRRFTTKTRVNDAAQPRQCHPASHRPLSTPTPKWVEQRRNPVGVDLRCDHDPRVSAARQPWAVGRNAFGVLRYAGVFSRRGEYPSMPARMPYPCRRSACLNSRIAPPPAWVGDGSRRARSRHETCHDGWHSADSRSGAPSAIRSRVRVTGRLSLPVVDSDGLPTLYGVATGVAVRVPGGQPRIRKTR